MIKYDTLSKHLTEKQILLYNNLNKIRKTEGNENLPIYAVAMLVGIDIGLSGGDGNACEVYRALREVIAENIVDKIRKENTMAQSNNEVLYLHDLLGTLPANISVGSLRSLLCFVNDDDEIIITEHGDLQILRGGNNIGFIDMQEGELHLTFRPDSKRVDEYPRKEL